MLAGRMLFHAPKAKTKRRWWCGNNIYQTTNAELFFMYSETFQFPLSFVSTTFRFPKFMFLWIGLRKTRFFFFFLKRCYLLRNEIWRTYDITEYGSKGQNSFSYFLVSSDKRNIRHLFLFSRDRWNHFEDSLHRLGFLSSSTEISKNSLNFPQWPNGLPNRISCSFYTRH